MKQYKVAIIGNGMICNAAHIPAYKAMGDKVKIVAVADIREEAARETAERHGIPKYYVDPYKMLEEENRILSRYVLPTPTTRSIPWPASGQAAMWFVKSPLR